MSFTRNLKLAVESKLPFAAWRMPEQSIQYLTVGRQVVKITNVQLEEISQGFVVGPYGNPTETNKELTTYLIKPALNFTSDEVSNVDFADKLAQLNQSAAGSGLSVEMPDATTENHYKNWVARSVSQIKDGKFQKIVAARTKTVSLPSSFQVEIFFDQLCQDYPHAFISMVYLPAYGLWVGATPELLIQQNNSGIFKTMALAGTQPKDAGTLPADAVWRQKDIEEQALVSRYIINSFKKIRLREFEEIGPRTIAAANLLHLRTDFIVDTKETQRPHLASEMLQLLHPTSAVCGMPLQKAANFVAENEGFDRKLYAGYLGPIGFSNNIDLFVNLRCLQIVGNKAVVYAGAGLTGDSIPDREWQETEAKCQTLLSVINKM